MGLSTLKSAAANTDQLTAHNGVDFPWWGYDAKGNQSPLFWIENNRLYLDDAVAEKWFDDNAAAQGWDMSSSFWRAFTQHHGYLFTYTQSIAAVAGLCEMTPQEVITLVHGSLRSATSGLGYKLNDGSKSPVIWWAVDRVLTHPTHTAQSFFKQTFGASAPAGSPEFYVVRPIAALTTLPSVLSTQPARADGQFVSTDGQVISPGGKSDRTIGIANKQSIEVDEFAGVPG